MVYQTLDDMPYNQPDVTVKIPGLGGPCINVVIFYKKVFLRLCILSDRFIFLYQPTVSSYQMKIYKNMNSLPC